MNNLVKTIEELEKLLKNFKKTPKRIYSAENLLAKRRLTDRLKDEFIAEYQQLTNEKKQLSEQLVIKYKTLYREIEKFLAIKTDEIKQILEKSIREEENYMEDSHGEDNNSGENALNSDHNHSSNMASFDMATTLKLIPEFDGNKKNLANFINLIEFLHDSIETQSEKAKLIKFVLKTRLNETVRNKLCNETEPASFSEFRTLFQKLFKTAQNPLKIQNELSRVQQGERSVQEFSNKIESLAAELNSIQIADQGEDNRTVIARLNDQLALNAFKCGLREPFKSTVFAAQPKTLTNAVQLAMEIDADNSNQARRVYRLNSNQNQRFSNFTRRPTYNYANGRQNNFNASRHAYGNNYNNSYNRNSYRQFQNNQFRNGSSNMNQRPFNRNQTRASNTNSQYRGNSSGRSGYQNRNPRRINLLNSENGQSVPAAHQSEDEEYRIRIQ